MAEEGSRPNRTLKYLAAAGLVGPVLFTAVWLVLGFLDPEYSHVRDPISLLGAVGAPNATAQALNFIVFGLLLIASAIGLQRGLPQGSWVAPAALGVVGAAILGAGFFPVSPTDPGSPVNPAEPGSLTSISLGVASLLALVAFYGLILAPVLFSPRLKRDPGWRNLRVYSIATTVVALVLFLSVSAFLPGGAGLHQRLLLAVVFVWIVVMAIRLLRQAPASVSPKPT